MHTFTFTVLWLVVDVLLDGSIFKDDDATDDGDTSV